VRTAPNLHRLPGGRALSYVDVGDPSGTPVAFFHGTPDSRRSRHPDDALAAAADVRLIAVDRPGIGGSTPHPATTVGTFADDVADLLAALGIDRCGVLAWSAGAPFGLALAARHHHLVRGVVVAAGLVPFAALAEPGILDHADGGRHLIAELGAEVGATATAEMAVPMLAPIPCDLALARELVLEGADERRRATFGSIAGALDAMAWGVVDAVAQGPDGLLREVALQVEDPDVSWTDVAVPVHLAYGAHDSTAPPAFGEWWQDALPSATLVVHPDEGHLLALTRWADLLARAAR